MIAVVFEQNHIDFDNKVREWIDKGYELKGAEIGKNYYDKFRPFFYAAILIKIN